ncbi:MAG: dihydroorotate dehydrogenase electron transfer subunit [Oscillospiraceae bacterium]|jgi:dihydroorotate dehydrogenase electron transfer subunit|nr:dihydroorotate dehydrogenase electron transfer subunit [Oscillospiraceae bacterium]
MKGEVLSLSPVADRTYDLRIAIKLENPAPGRFVHVAVPGFSLRRPISLCGYENGVARLVFIVKGRGTAALAKLRKGGDVDVLGPLGNGFPEGSEGKTVLVGGGIGIPPLLYYAKTYQNTHAIAGFRSRESMVLTEEFPSLDICTDDGSAGLAFFPHERLETYMSLKGAPARVLACGPYPLLKAVAEVCKRRGVPCFVSVEERMACGVGACLVCACAVGGQYKRVCKDGPVFDASDVCFEEGNV